jgi:hypothetical protein
VNAGVLALEDDYDYELVFDEAFAAVPGASRSGVSFGSVAKQQPLRYLTCEINPLKAQARSVGEPNDEHFPVFYTADAYKRAEDFARRGADAATARETGAVLIGTACTCPETGEFFLVVTDALEATDAEEEKLSLSYTGKTWLRLQAVLKSIQSQPGAHTIRFLGQSHGHNFIPLDGAPPCEMCANAKYCSRTSVFASAEDRTWTQAVFAGAPYALCHVFGLNARREHVHGLFSLYESRLTQRGFYILHAFNPAAAS